jgi:hypothetical protein
MSEKARLIAQCKAIQPTFRVVESLVPQGSVFECIFADGTTMRMQFARGRYSIAQKRDIKLQMLREALIALRFAAPQPALESTNDAPEAECSA